MKTGQDRDKDRITENGKGRLHLRLTGLNGQDLYHSFVSGANEVILQKNQLNEINVFPVADGDTGTNLASTMFSLIEEAKVLKSAKETMVSIADAMLTGARGNSGIIFAQYVNGITESMVEEDTITMKSFARSVKDAVPHAYQAIAHPVEGTMITVIRDWAEAVYAMGETASDFYELLAHGLTAARQSLKETTGKLKVLEDAHVVDSGAKGFVHFVDGFTKFLQNGKVPDVDLASMKDTEISEYVEHDSGELTHRYCTEALIEAKGIDREVLKAELESFGDSLIVAGNDRRVRLHVHTDNPQDFFLRLRGKGKILQQKVDDMRKQYEAAHARRYPIALVTDSIADLPQEMVDKYQIHMIPLNLLMEETSYLDKVTITADSFYTLLDEIKGYPTSAQPGVKLVENLFSFLTSHYDEVIAITVAKELSGTYNTVLKAAEKFATEGKRIKVIDSKQNSGAEGLLVLKAAEEIDKGRTFDEVVETVEKVRADTKILVSVNTLKYMVRSGRVSKVTGIAGKIMNLMPVISLDSNGKGTIADKAFSLKGNTRKIVKRIEKMDADKPITRYAIVHANALDRAAEYTDIFRKVLGMEPEYVMNISPIVGMSAGVGCVAIAAMSEEGA